MVPKKQIVYTKAVIVCHGKSEYILAEYIKTNLKLPIKIYAEQKGRSSIQINGIDNFLHNTIFKSKKNFCKEFNFEYKKDDNIDGKIFIIMDTDDASEKEVTDFKSGKMFNKHWAKGNIVSIWNIPQYDTVMHKMKIIDKLPNDKEKGIIYSKAFPMRHDGKSDISKIQELSNMCKKCKNTNMNEMLEWLLGLV